MRESLSAAPWEKRHFDGFLCKIELPDGDDFQNDCFKKNVEISLFPLANYDRITYFVIL